MGAQLMLLTLKNKNLQGGLYLKEEHKNRHWKVLFPGGRGQEVTGDVFMGRQALIKAEKTQKTWIWSEERLIWQTEKRNGRSRRQNMRNKRKDLLLVVLQWPKLVLCHFWRMLFWMQRWANQLHSPLTLGECKTYRKGKGASCDDIAFFPLFLLLISYSVLFCSVLLHSAPPPTPTTPISLITIVHCALWLSCLDRWLHTIDDMYPTYNMYSEVPLTEQQVEVLWGCVRTW